MPKKLPIYEIGTKFGDWTVIAIEVKDYAGKANVAFSRVSCVCGTEKSIPNFTLRTGRTNGCGCRGRRIAGESRVTHGKSGSPIYRLWLGIKYRLKTQLAYKDITLYAAWETDFPAFEKFILGLGDKPTPAHTLDRINPFGNYEPGNLRWADKQTQALNRTNSVENTLNNSKVLIGQKYDMLTVLELVIKARGKRNWPAARVKCECGTIKVVYLMQLFSDRTKSCGCYKNRNLLLGPKTVEKLLEINGVTKNYSQWAAVAGISLQAFAYRIASGWTPEQAICPSDRDDGMITANGVTKHRSEWAKDLGILAETITRRLKTGWTPEEAVFTGKNKRYQRK